MGNQIGKFSLYRATRLGHDNRLTETLSTRSGTFGFWFITFVWNLCCSLPYLLGLLSNRSNTLLVQSGGLVFMIGLIIETTADLQKWMFKQSNPSGTFCNVGLWSISQHPNFFGNWVLWAGIFLMNLPALILPGVPITTAAVAGRGGQGAGWIVWNRYHRVGLALLSPLFLGSLLYGQASGVITNATELALSKYGHDPAYLKYCATTPKIVPDVFRLGRP